MKQLKHRINKAFHRIVRPFALRDSPAKKPLLAWLVLLSRVLALALSIVVLTLLVVGQPLAAGLAGAIGQVTLAFFGVIATRHAST